MIDVLRSTTTIVHALAAGAREVVPCAEVEEARRIARQFPPDQVVLGGERGGLAVKGFDLGNSPEDYTPDRLRGKTLVITTTNGTRAMAHARNGGADFPGGLRECLGAVRATPRAPGNPHLCSGTEGQSSDDDNLLAGMMVDHLQRGDGLGHVLNAQAITAQEMWLHKFALPLALGAERLEPERLAEALRDTPGGRNLVELGLDADILAAARIDRFAIVPELDPATFRIRGK